jgi:hypothetical protein
MSSMVERNAEKRIPDTGAGGPHTHAHVQNHKYHMIRMYMYACKAEGLRVCVRPPRPRIRYSPEAPT